MIQSLTIRNFVLIDNLTIFFRQGMQVLSGETGAGKSIVVDAVNLILGGRADRGLIRTGCEKATVEAVFDVPDNRDVKEILEREKIDYDGNTVVLYREISAAGRNLCRVCGIIVQAGLLRDLGSKLMDIHGQHEHQFLMDPDMQLSFLDRMGDREHRAALNRTADACSAFLQIHRRYAKMRKENEQKNQRQEELEKALRELHAARLKSGEEESLQAEVLRLRNAEKILSVLRSVRDSLNGGEDGAGGLERVRTAFTSLKTLETYDEKMKLLAGRCESAYYELEEAAYEVSSLTEEFDRDPGKLEKAEARLDLIRRLERKYGPELRDVLAEQARMEKEYEELCSLEDRLSETAAEHKRMLAVYRTEARNLSESRKRLASLFEMGMMAQLKDLGMEKTVFSVLFAEPEGNRKPMPRPSGDDQIEFRISPNPGESLKPLARTASGGELSRIMLALKAMEAEDSGVDCMVFDEIDTGISGRTAQTVAEKMCAIARKRQVICVTHLPQIAAAADYQFLVAKTVSDGRTHTGVTMLNREERIREVARMVSGADGVGADSVSYAAKMIEAGEKMKKPVRKKDL